VAEKSKVYPTPGGGGFFLCISEYFLNKNLSCALNYHQKHIEIDIFSAKKFCFDFFRGIFDFIKIFCLTHPGLIFCSK
jgi:hypothetical protein